MCDHFNHIKCEVKDRSVKIITSESCQFGLGRNMHPDFRVIYFIDRPNYELSGVTISTDYLSNDAREYVEGYKLCEEITNECDDSFCLPKFEKNLEVLGDIEQKITNGEMDDTTNLNLEIFDEVATSFESL